MADDPRPIRVLIVDDEAPARFTLQHLLQTDPEVEVVGECSDGPQAIAGILEASPDLIFLDVQMPGMDGFQVLEKIGPERAPQIVFVTAYSEHAVHAFEVQAVDYLLKPFDDARFFRALARAKLQLREGRALDLACRLSGLLAALRTRPADGQDSKYLERITLREGGRISFLGVEEIDWIEAKDYYAEIHAGPAEHLLRESLQRLQEQLDPARFLRVHRSVIINVSRIDSLLTESQGGWRVHLRGGACLKVSRAYRARLRERFGM
jgi:two-component system, LytTR family, response regulator